MVYFETNLFEITNNTDYILIYSNVKIIGDGVYKYSNYNHSLNIEKISNNYILYKITNKEQTKYLINIEVKEPNIDNNNVIISFVDKQYNNIKSIIYDFYYFDKLSKYKYKIINNDIYDNYSTTKILKNIKQGTQDNTYHETLVDKEKTTKHVLKPGYDTLKNELDELKSEILLIKKDLATIKSLQYDIISKSNVVHKSGKKIGLNFI